MAKGKRLKAGTSKSATATRKEKFVNEVVLNGGNQTQAAIAAGYSPDSARTQASRLATDANIVAAVQARRQQLLAIDDITAERIKLQFGRIAFADVRRLHDEDGELLPMKEWDDDNAVAAAGVHTDGRTGKRELKMHDPVSALDKLARIHGMYEKDNQQRRDDLSIQIAVIDPTHKKE